MLVLKVLFFILVLFGSEKGLASARRCFGCVSIKSCETGLKFARMVINGLLPDSNRQTFLNAICGSDDSDPRIPKVCCSDFPDLPTHEPGSLANRFVNPIETHRNVGSLPTHESRSLENRFVVPIKTHRNVGLLPTHESRSLETRFVDPSKTHRNVGLLPTHEPGSLTNRFEDPIETHRNVGLLPTLCGDMDGTRIVGGRYAKLYEFPWMTLIAYSSRSDDKEYKCGGSVINSRYILTAAHCVINTRTLKYRNIIEVRIGEWDVSTETDCQGAYQNMICETKIQDIEVDEIIPHEDFTGQQPVENDIALLRLKRPIEMENNAAPICLPIYSDLRSMHLSGINGTVAGWGATETSASSTKLMKVNVPIKSGDVCNFYYDRFDTTIENVFCAGAIYRDSCNGDSGGPLMIETNFNGSIRMVQFGIVSYGPKKCGSNFPGIYTDVTKYMNWILDNIRE